MSVTEIQNYLYEESKRIEPKNCRQPLKFARKWPEISLKSPGIKPMRRPNNSANSSLNLAGTLTSSNKAPFVNKNDTGAEQQSPPASSSSASVADQAVFANVNINSSSSSSQNHHHHQQQSYQYQHHSQGSMQYYPGQHQSVGGQQQNHHYYHHGQQHSLSQSVVNLTSTADHQMAPEIPRRSDSIILTSSLSSQIQYNLNNSSYSESSSNHSGGSKLVPSPRYPSSSMSALSSSSSGMSVSSFFGIMSASNSDASGLGGSLSSSAATNAASIVSLSEGPTGPPPPPPPQANAATAISPGGGSMSSPSASTSSAVTAVGPLPYCVGSTVSAPPAPVPGTGADIPPAISPRTDKPAVPPAPPPLRNHGGGGTEFCYNTSGLPTSPLATSSSTSFRISSSNTLKNQNCDFTTANSAVNRSSCENSPIYPSSPQMHPTGAASAMDFNSSAISPSLSTSFSSTSSTYQTAYNNSSTTADSMILSTTTASNDLGPPHSPHVNVPNTHNIPPPMPPPLPPRVKRKESSGESLQSSQVRQAPDAPKLPPRDISPPPLPPRTHIQSHYLFGNVQQQHQLLHSSGACDSWNHINVFSKDESPSSSSSSSTLTRDNLNQHNISEQQLLMLPHTSTIMMRRNSAMDRASKENLPNITASPSLSRLSSTATAGGVPGGLATASGPVSLPSCSAPPPPCAAKNKSVQNSPVSQQQQAVVCGRRPSTNISPRFSPGETTPKLPPKPKQTNLSSHSDRTMFPYPSTN